MHTPNVTLLASTHPLWREEVLTRLRAGRPELVVVRHELATIEVDGCVHRTVTRTTTEDRPLAVDERCCLSCLLREDTAAVLTALATEPGPLEILIVLPVAVEPLTAATTLGARKDVVLDAVIAAVDAARLEDDLVQGSPLPASGIPDDPRGHAEVLVRQLRHADVVLHNHGDDRSDALIEALAPRALRLAADTAARGWLGTGRHQHHALLAELQTAVPRACTDVDRAGVRTARWLRRRPLHPHRLLEALEDGSLLGVARIHGYLWVATRPGTVIEMEAGFDGCELAAVDAWLSATPGVDPARVPPIRRAVAEDRWHPYYGDRVQELVLVTLDRDPAEALQALDACLLTDAELAEGEEGWLTWHDPFREWLGEEAAFLSSASNDPEEDTP